MNARIIRNEIKFDLQTQMTNFILIRKAVSDIKEADEFPAVLHSFLHIKNAITRDSCYVPRQEVYKHDMPQSDHRIQ